MHVIIPAILVAIACFATWRLTSWKCDEKVRKATQGGSGGGFGGYTPPSEPDTSKTHKRA